MKMLAKMQVAVQHAFQKNQLPWLLSAMTDWSYEVGNANGFLQYTRHYEEFLTPVSVTSRMRCGINGWLAEELGSEQMLRGADIVFRTIDGQQTEVEVKLSYDCTLKKYHSSYSQDRLRLTNSRADNRFQVIYLVSLPNYSYPPGTWSGKQHKGREVVNLGIQKQWQAIQNVIPFPTCWPDGGIKLMHFDPEITKAASVYIKQLLDGIYRPQSPWAFDAQKHLSDATVGVALWNVE